MASKWTITVSKTTTKTFTTMGFLRSGDNPMHSLQAYIYKLVNRSFFKSKVWSNLAQPQLKLLKAITLACQHYLIEFGQTSDN